MASTPPSHRPSAASPPRPRRKGRPTLEQAAQLDRDVREHALHLFLEHGYDGTSMDAIAEAAGTTKASLYARFPSKEAVFSSVLDWAIKRSDWPTTEPTLRDPDDLEDALTTVANAALRRAIDPSMVKLQRIAVAEASRHPEIARSAATAGSSPRQQLIVDLLRRHAAAGTITADEPEILAEHFVAMVAGMPARLASFGIVRDPETQRRYTTTAVRLFVDALRRG